MVNYSRLPCGARMPESVHAVSVSLPALADLVGYEEQRPEVLRRVPSGYPRFHIHPYVVRLQEHIVGSRALKGRQTRLVSSQRALDELCAFAGIARPEVIPYKDLVLLILPEDEAVAGAAKAFLQHTGSGISSRFAEDLLIEEGLLAVRQEEQSMVGDADGHARGALARAYGAGGPDDVLLGSFGMNALYAIYKSLGKIQEEVGRNEWVQFGWLFMDTIHTLKKLRAPGAEGHVISSTLDVDALEAVLRERGGRIAGIVTETPSNPLMQTPDVERLRSLSDRYGCALVIDATLGTPHNVDVLPYADVVIESLTKYAAGSADVMMGAAVLNPRSRFHGALRSTLPQYLAKPYRRDVERLAFQITGYADRMKRVNRNTLALVEFLEKRRTIKRVRWAYAPETRHNFEKIQRAPGSPGGIITLELAVPLADVYDRLPLAKGPSLGAEFTLVGPYLYHAHYELVSTEAGRAFLRQSGLDPELLRISVGIEEPEELFRAFSSVL